MRRTVAFLAVAAVAALLTFEFGPASAQSRRGRGSSVSAKKTRARPPTWNNQVWRTFFADALSKLSRYETTLERSMFRALHELQRLQAARSGQSVAPPAVLDVEVSSSRG